MTTPGICPECWREHPASEPCTTLAERTAANTALLARQSAERLTREASNERN